ncbi:GTPase [Rhodopila globiformis]|uniref:G domain-containing protein n=1 Tax=Rhodopila globiformis TaxID=1071 RepID=A0A2S6NLL2_RHOGL|nr:GTPase [Rhodopila globiformis]PPQ36232.1 hypothetical protein CCS01_05420 [Rhodopila globiformis]
MEALFSSIVADLETVRSACEQAGLPAESGPGSTAWTLLGGAEEADRFRREALMLGALMRLRVARLVFQRSGPRHLVVFGGNNVGKSTVVNILAAASVAGTSPEGGHTRHAEAFSMSEGPLFAWNPYAFAHFRQVPPAALENADFDCYAVAPIASDVLPPDVVLWDSPDCDAVGSIRYLAAVVEAVAAADVVVYVTSVEKYAVADLVEWVFDLSDAGIPILECVNKTSRKDRSLLVQRQAEDVFPAVARRTGLRQPDIPVVALRYMTEGEEPDLWGEDHPEATDLRDAALSRLAERHEVEEARAALRSVRRRLDHVLEPARREHAVRATWRAAVRDAVAGFVRTYEAEYLSGESVIEPFKQLNATLLEMLNPDIPIMAGAIRGLRAVQRIPTRLLQAAARGFASLFNEADHADSKLAPELKAYAMAHRSLLASLFETIAAERRAYHHHPFWDRLSDEWDRRTVRLADDFSQATVLHMERTDAEIKAAAADVLRALQQRPNVLTLLKMARVSLDVSGLLVGFAIPGHGSVAHDLLQDVVIAPAMLGATGFAASSAVEGYVAQRRAEIIDKLRADAREMADTLYVQPLEQLGDAIMASIGALGIDQALLDRLPADLRRLADGVGA